MDEVVQIIVPTAATMDRSGFEVLDTYGKGLMVKGVGGGTCQELFACQTKREFKISPLEQKDVDVLYTAEETTFFWRFCCNGIRPLEQTVTVGGQPGGPTLMNISSPYICCKNASMDFSDAEGKNLGRATSYGACGLLLTGWCDLCDVYNIKLTGPDGNTEYHIHQPTCFGGFCVDYCECKGTPFYIYKAENDQPKEEVGKINRVVPDRSTVYVEFPEDADAETKARLLGTSIFIHHLFFEKTPYQL